MAGVPLDQRDGWIWFDGEMIPWKDTKVHVLTHALHYASSVFEGQRAYNGEIYKLHDHSLRLRKSAELLDFEVPYTADQLDQACRDVLAKNNLVDAYMRPVAFRGSAELGLGAHNNPVHVAIAAWEWPSLFSHEDKLKGTRLALSDWRRPAPTSAPFASKAAGLYMICTLSKHAAEARGFADAMMLDYRGQIAEATGANVFFVKDGEIHTPIPDCFLDGITRRTVIGLAREAGIKVTERVIMPEELGNFDECFLTGSAAEVVPVAEIEGNIFPEREICSAMMKAYSAEVQPKKAAAE
ncbi:branched-chain amino acid aminotransferase [Maritalea porphyrae]|jgi:branched-chain amino acid aminotransferase|uniref:branched-chain amino acid aminotransferase n=3 Tax=Maritalea TaxID=623276 RepID=UPI0022AE62D8|nr:branched-chain amino acid aminotransferase [Maritalea porphyrae]MCZ4274109.1 branched-chain amino acid aminotransferase [Maritalea porphyrae]